MEIMSHFKSIFSFKKKTKKNETGDTVVTTKEEFPLRFFDFKKPTSNSDSSEEEHSASAKSDVGVTYKSVINRSEKISFNNKILTITLGALVMKMIFWDEQTTIIPPPNQTEEIRITGNKASESYKTQWGMFYASTAGNINPRNVDFVIGYLTQALAPSLQSQVIKEMKTAANVMETRGVEQTFVAQDVNYDPINDIVYVWGTKTTKLINVANKTDTSRWTYEMVIGIRKGVPRIAFFNQYAGTPNLKKVTVNGKEVLDTLDDIPDLSEN